MVAEVLLSSASELPRPSQRRKATLFHRHPVGVLGYVAVGGGAVLMEYVKKSIEVGFLILLPTFGLGVVE